MGNETKPVVDYSDTFEKLDIRLAKVVSAEIEPSAPKKAYKLILDFGKFGQRVSVGRFTQHSPEELIGRTILGVINFSPRQIGDVESEVLVLGVQFPKADSGEATPITTLNESAKIGGKLF